MYPNFMTFSTYDDFWKYGDIYRSLWYTSVATADTSYGTPAYPAQQCEYCNTEVLMINSQAMMAHYTSAHNFSCSTCHTSFRTSHLLQLHIAECHDAFFFTIKQRQPSFACLRDDCDRCFWTGQDRNQHSAEAHNITKVLLQQFPPQDKHMSHAAKPSGLPVCPRFTSASGCPAGAACAQWHPPNPYLADRPRQQRMQSNARRGRSARARPAGRGARLQL